MDTLRCKIVCAVLSFALLFSGTPDLSHADTFFGTVSTGLLELEDYRYPVFLYVPQNYKPDRYYSMIVTVPDEGESPEEHIRYWTGWARRRSMLVLCATNLWPEDTPYGMDEWLLGIKKDVLQRYRVNPGRVFLAGRGGGAHYASYLGVNYPEEFSAAVLLGQAWHGKYSKLLLPQRRAKRQIPFLVVAPDEESLTQNIEKEALELESKGYVISLMKVKDEAQYDSDKFKKSILEWLQEHSETWSQRVDESQKSIKEKTRSWIEKFFQV